MKSTRGFVFLVAGALAGAPLAAQGAQPTSAPSPVAKANRMLEAADEVAKEVAEIRGRAFRHPVKKDVRTEAQLRRYIEKNLFEEEMGGGKLERTEAWLKLLGLMPASLDFAKTITDVLLNQIGGFYDPKKQTFYMMAESSRFGDVVNRMLMAHELCHALDDQYLDLERLMHPGGARKLTEDEGYAIGAVVEGSATALMFVWMARKMKDGEIDTKALLEVQKNEMARSRELLEVPRYFTLIVANYMVGRSFVTKGVGMARASQDSGAAIEEIAKDPPRSTEQVLHPKKYWDLEQRDEPVRVANDDALVARIERATGRSVLQRDTLGELVCAIVTLKRRLNMTLMAQPRYWTNKFAKGWGGDRLYLVGGRDPAGAQDLSAPGLVWVTAWDTEADRQEFVAGMRRTRGKTPGFDLAERGRIAVLTFGTCRQVVGAADVLAAARFTKDGAVWQ